jgi:hypothetical protein
VVFSAILTQKLQQKSGILTQALSRAEHNFRFSLKSPLSIDSLVEDQHFGVIFKTSD